MALFFNHNSDPVPLDKPYSHNSGPILLGTKSTPPQEPGASRSVFGSWLGPFSWEEMVPENGCDFFLGHRKYINTKYFLHPKIKVPSIFWQGVVSGKWCQPMFQCIFLSHLLLGSAEISLDWCRRKISCLTVAMNRGSSGWKIENNAISGQIHGKPKI